MKSALIPLADGAEELEAVTIIDVLIRGGLRVFTASISDQREVTCSRGVTLKADHLLAEFAQDTFDVIALPGGAVGAENLSQSADLKKLLLDQAAAGRYYAASCASPAVVLSSLGLLKDKTATCYPSFGGRMEAATHSEDNVVVDGNCIPSKGPATAMAFALQLIESLISAEKRNEVAMELLHPH